MAQQEGSLAALCSMPKFIDKDSTRDVANLFIEGILQGLPVIKIWDKLREEIESFRISIAGFGGRLDENEKRPALEFCRRGYC